MTAVNVHSATADVRQPPRVSRAVQEWLLLGAVLGAVGLFVLWNRFSEHREVDAEQRRLLAVQAIEIDQDLSRQIAGIGAALRGVRSNLNAGAMPEGRELSRRFGLLAEAIPGLRTLTLLDRDGRALASSRPERLGRDFGVEPYFRQARAHPDPQVLQLTPPALTPQRDMAMHLSLVLTTGAGAFDGALDGTLDPAFFRGVLHASLYAPDVWSAVAHGDGISLAHEPPVVDVAGRNLDVPGSFFRRHRESGQVASVMTGVVAVTGEDRMMAQRTVRLAGLAIDKPLVIAVSRSTAAMFAPWRRQTVAYAGLYALFVATASIALVFMQRRQRALDAMEAQREILERQSAERLTLALRGADLGLWDLDVRSGDSVVSERWNSMLGLPHQPLHRGSVGWSSRVHPDDWARVRVAQREHLEGRSERFEQTYRMRHADGRWVWILDRAQVIERDAAGAALRMAGTHMDVTEAQERQLALRANEERLQALLDNLRAGVIVHGADTHIIDANPAACRITGLSLEQMRGRVAIDPDWAFLEEDHSPMVLARFPVSQVMASGDAVKSLVLGVRRVDLPRPLWVLVDAYPLRDAQGQIEQVVVTFSDITERKEAEEELHLLATAVASLNDVVMITEADPLDPPGPRVQFVNEAFERMTGWTRAEAIGRTPRMLQGPKTDRAELARIGAALRRGEAVHAELLNYTKQGAEYWVEISVVPISDRSGRITHQVAIERDVTERRRAEDGLQRLNRSLRVLSACNLNLAEVVDETEYLRHVCQSVVRAGGYLAAWVGYAEDDAEKSVRVVADAGDERGYLRTVSISWDGGSPNGRGPTGAAIRSGQTQIDQNWHTNPLVTPWREAALQRGLQSSIGLPLHLGGRCIGALTVYAAEADAFNSEEVAPLEELARNLTIAIESLRARQQRDAAERANHAKSAFLASMSHEIRTPLNAIIGLNYLMRRDGVTPAQAARLDRIEGASQHLLGIVNDVLDLSKIEAGRVQLESVNFHLSAILDNVHSIIAESAREKGLTVDVDGDAVPLWLRGDPTRLRQALLNLAGNAVKFTEQGRIVLRARLLHDAGDALLVRFAVEDTGIGIAAENLARLFRDFEQAEASTTRRFGGTGLGLSITQRLSQLMGGECGVESQPGQGSTFWFTARLNRGHGPMPLPPDADANEVAEGRLRERHRGARLLLAEDNEVNREVALAMLHGLGLHIDIAATGLEALQLARTQVYDLVLMDMQMPEMGGLEATRAIRALPGWQRRPILAFTANAFDEDRRACEAAGMDDFISKPMDVNSLYAILLKWLDDAAAPEVVALTPP
jgi:PAS domain S-box-containing protein